MNALRDAQMLRAHRGPAEKLVDLIMLLLVVLLSCVCMTAQDS
jgi:hypothetical protein